MKVRRPWAGVATVGLVATAGLPAGCGGDGSGGSTEAIEEFCAGFDEINRRFEEDANLVEPTALGRLAEMMRELDPPEAIADDYAVALAGVEALSRIDVTNADAVAQVEGQLPQAQEALRAVTDFVDEEC